MSFKPCTATLAVAFAAGCGGPLPTFGADLGRQTSPMGEVRVPYEGLVSYFGYVEAGAEPDEVRGGEKLYYVYLWIPVVAPEIGLRMVSPVGRSPRPQAGDFVDAAFAASSDGYATNYFDTWARLERCLTATGPDDIPRPCGKWASLGENDDSPELPAQPSGERHNSVVRVTSTPGDPLRALTRGVYRIAFKGAKADEVRGSFLVQVGAPVPLTGTAIARTPAELARIVTPTR